MSLHTQLSCALTHTSSEARDRWKARLGHAMDLYSSKIPCPLPGTQGPLVTKLSRMSDFTALQPLLCSEHEVRAFVELLNIPTTQHIYMP